MFRLRTIIIITALITFSLSLAESPAKEPAAGVKANPKDFTNPIGMKFVYIPPGTFTMGSPPNEPGRDLGETQHKVTLSKGFYMQTTEVTQGQWKKVMGKNPSFFDNCGDNAPVEQASWEDVREFLRKLGQIDKTRKYRLPTEAEWEYACRAGTAGKRYFGEDDSRLMEHVWYEDTACGQTNPVGQMLPNLWGLYDMQGNVWEWCQDWYGDYPAGAVTNPAGPARGQYRVVRGGSWFCTPNLLRSAKRHWFEPSHIDFILGFRCVSDLNSP